MQNLIKVFDFADKEDIKIAECAWTKMNKLTADIAEKHDFHPRIGAAVFAALSPNNDFKGNLRDTDRLLLSARKGLGIDDFKVSTYGNNKRKAWRIAHGGEEPLDLIVFPKTRSFFMNVHNPLDPLPVTVDGHMLNAWNGERIRLNRSRPSDDQPQALRRGRHRHPRDRQSEGHHPKHCSRNYCGTHGNECTASSTTRSSRSFGIRRRSRPASDTSRRSRKWSR
jgi:hypothetical protein